MSEITHLNVARGKTRQEVIEVLEAALRIARNEEVTEVVVVMEGKDRDGPAFFRNTDFDDGWRLMGALEYAKDAVLKGLSVR